MVAEGGGGLGRMSEGQLERGRPPVMEQVSYGNKKQSLRNRANHTVIVM